MRIPVKLLIIFQIILFVSFSNTPLEAETLFESFGVGLPAVNVSDTPEGETTFSLSLQIKSTLPLKSPGICSNQIFLIQKRRLPKH